MKRFDIEESKALKWMVALCDLVLLSLCLVGCYYFYQATDPATTRDVDLQVYLTMAVLCYMAPVTMFSFILFERTARGEKVVERAFQLVLTHILLLFAALFLLKTVAIARTLLLTYAVLFWLLLTAERLSLLYLIRWFRSKGKNSQHVVFVGREREMAELHDYMQNREYGYNVLGIFTDEEPGQEGLERLGGTDDVLAYLEEHPYVNAVYCTMARMSKESLIELYRYCENHLVRFYALPIYLSFLRRNMQVTHIGSTVMLYPRREPLRRFENRLLKRLSDLFVSVVLLSTLFPIIYVIVAIIIKRQSPGPVIFVQRRNGLNGAEFNCYKFRSMHVNADSDSLQATEHDTRKFPFGDLMRRTNIDELPQFINVLLGSMSVVGPRPHMLAHTAEYSHIINKYMVRHWVKPGITGWAQVNGFRGETRDVEQMEKRVQADIWYVENWNFWLDVRIIWRTLVNTLFRRDKNAY
ncbi:MAG: undecaprenyl-phosphate glucose phosphotransferase [Bacteroidaceae bacterium]|nr:undecaprenyl-phosphate glucose phosphotransferase [Bacteroidaceae bacterium]